MSLATFSEIFNAIVLVRVCYDISNPEDTSRIKDSLPTIKNLLHNSNKVVIATHWGRPEGSEDKQKSTQNLISVIQKEFHKFDIPDQIQYINQYQSFQLAGQQIRNSKNKVFLLENTRFEINEKSKDVEIREKLAKDYALLAEFFVDESFAVSHRKEATNTEIKNCLPSFYGASYQHEIMMLDKLKKEPQEPFVVIMAGAKLETKLPLIEKMLKSANKVLLAGMLAFVFVKVSKDLGLKINGQDVNSYPELYESKIETDFYDKAQELLAIYEDKIKIPVDFQYGELFGQKEVFDIGPKTIEFFKSELEKAKTIFWNGTLGYYEQEPYNQGTLELAKYVSQLKDSFKVLGGGDTHSAIPEDIINKFNFASMGGGATLSYLSQE